MLASGLTGLQRWHHHDCFWADWTFDGAVTLRSLQTGAVNAMSSSWVKASPSSLYPALTCPMSENPLRTGVSSAAAQDSQVSLVRSTLSFFFMIRSSQNPFIVHTASLTLVQSSLLKSVTVL